MPKIYVNGEFVEKEEATISIYDHGLLYGDGIFEGIRAYDGYVFKLKEHLDRLYRSGRAIMLEIPLSFAQMEEAILETLRVNDLKTAYIRPLITRGAGDLGLDPRKCGRPSVLIMVREWESLYGEELFKKGLRAIVTTVRNQAPESLPPAVKTLNYLTNIMARIQANVWGADEAIMLDIRGNVSEGSADNIFIYKGERFYSPPVMNNLPGITRDLIIDLLSKDGYEVREQHFGIAELYMADEVFVTGTAAEVAPIVEIDGRIIGDGKPGPMTKKIADKFRQLTGKPETGKAIYE